MDANSIPALEQLRTALDEEGALTDPAALTDAGINRIVGLAYQANAELNADLTQA